MPSRSQNPHDDAPKVVCFFGPQWPWLVGALIVFGLLLKHQLTYMGVEEMPVPVFVFTTMPTAAGWAIVGVAGLYVLLFSVRSSVTIDPAFKSIRTATWVLGVVPVHGARRSFKDVRYVRIGLASSLSHSFGNAMEVALKYLVLAALFGIWARLLHASCGLDDSPASLGNPISQIVFHDREAWILSRGRNYLPAARQAAALLGVRLGA